MGILHFVQFSIQAFDASVYEKENQQEKKSTKFSFIKQQFITKTQKSIIDVFMHIPNQIQLTMNQITLNRNIESFAKYIKQNKLFLFQAIIILLLKDDSKAMNGSVLTCISGADF